MNCILAAGRWRSFCSTLAARPGRAGIGYWARALQHAQADRQLGRRSWSGRGPTNDVVSVSQERISEMVAEFGFRDHLATSAKEGWGVAELRAAILAAMNWVRMPMVTSSALFAAAKSFVLEQKAAGTLLTPLASLLASFLTTPITGPVADRMPKWPGPAGFGSGKRLRNACAPSSRDAWRGWSQRVWSSGSPSGTWCCCSRSSLTCTPARSSTPRGTNPMAWAVCWSRARSTSISGYLPRSGSPTQQEKLLIIATLEELTRHEIVLREETEDGVQLVFPAAFRRDLPEAAAGQRPGWRPSSRGRQPISTRRSWSG